MKHLNQLVLLSSFSWLLKYAVADRPRGVGPEFAKFYQIETKFKCISNPTIVIKNSQVNDDYCDCPDGSDEPGTAACCSVSPLSPPSPITSASYNNTLAIPGFYCKNRHHIPAYLPHMRVNDGVCDYELCCDGTDEWAGVGGVRCADQCKEMGKVWRRRQELKADILQKALTKRALLVTESKGLRKEVKTQIQDLEHETQEIEQKVTDLKKAYENIKYRERGRMLSSRGAVKGKKLAVLASLVKIRFEELRRALSEAVNKSDALQKRVNELEKILSDFKEDYNPNFNDEGVKRTVKAWEDYAANQKVSENDNLEDEFDIDVLLTPDDEEQGINWSEWDTEEDSNSGVFYKFVEYIPISFRNWLETQLINFRIFLMDNGILPTVSTEETEIKVVTEAREAYESKSNELDLKKATLKKQREDLAKDYGKDDVFRTLEGRCLEKDSGEYTYELCWLKGTKQKSKKSGSQTIMGTFVAFDKISIEDDDVGAGVSESAGSGEYITLNYKNGQNCWNGPSRETLVVLGCADEDIIWKISELEKCKYRMDVGSPAGC